MSFAKRTAGLASGSIEMSSLVNEIRRATRVRVSAVRTQISQDRAEVALWTSAVSGGPSFVAVVQSTDLGHRHDGPDSRRLNGSWLGRVLPQGECVLDR
jgi:hypothetical protein